MANVRFGSKADIEARPLDVRFTPKSGHCLARLECPLCANRRHMQCSKQPVNLGTFRQVLGSLTDYNFASADEDDLGVLRSIAPSHHGYIVQIDPNGLCFEISGRANRQQRDSSGRHATGSRAPNPSG